LHADSFCFIRRIGGEATVGSPPLRGPVTFYIDRNNNKDERDIYKLYIWCISRAGAALLLPADARHGARPIGQPQPPVHPPK
jgi:hypothetical protein